MNIKSPAEQIALKQEPVSVTDDTATDTLDDFIERAMERIISKNIDREKLKIELASDCNKELKTAQSEWTKAGKSLESFGKSCGHFRRKLACLNISFLLIGYQKVKKTDISNLASVWLS